MTHASANWTPGLTRTAVMFAVTIAAAILTAKVTRADETFVCADGSFVTVLPGQLEAMKRTDPCVAAHYGITLPARGATPPVPGATALAPPLAPEASYAPREAPLPERAPPRPADAIADKLRSIGAGDALDPTSPDAEAVAMAAARKGQPSDYRNVLILNATPGSERYFRHVR
ncbi:MAG: hypothetical protein NW205_00640 [Hyphomicrobiaceae bacterium]|nr:hypothetical protein [Hyphomicrobiaceae bacterium]